MSALTASIAALGSLENETEMATSRVRREAVGGDGKGKAGRGEGGAFSVTFVAWRSIAVIAFAIVVAITCLLYSLFILRL